MILHVATLLGTLGWAESYAGTIQALSAIVVAILTLFLVLFTRQYVKGTESAVSLSREQLQLLREQTAEQRRALDLAKEQYERAALESHREELGEKVLQPLRQILSQCGEPMFSADFTSQHHYDPGALASESPIRAGINLEVTDPGIDGGTLDAALLDDAGHNHYRLLVADWRTFRDSWSQDRDRRRNWIEDMARRILEDSQLAAHPTGDNGPYVMQLLLALFVYERIMQRGTVALTIVEGYLNGDCLSSGGQNLAKGTNEQMNALLKFVGNLIETDKHRGTEFGEQLSKLEADRASLSHRFSVAIATKTLPERCPFVGLG